MIPKIIHQTWKTADVAEPNKTWQQSWKHHHPEHTMRLYTDQDNAAFVHEYYPEHVAVYTGYRHKIQALDMVRLMYLHKHGGIYADMDMQCLKNTDSVFDQETFVLEPGENRLDVATLVANWVIAAEPNSGFLTFILDQMLRQPFTYTGSLAPDVCYSTGCGFITHCWHQYKPTARVVSSFLFSPYTHKQMRRMHTTKTTPCTDIEGAYGIHHFQGSWW